MQKWKGQYIVVGSLIAETSHFIPYYFAPTVRMRKKVPWRYEDGGLEPTYAVDGVAEFFYQIGRVGGKLKEVWWSSEEDMHIPTLTFCSTAGM